MTIGSSSSDFGFGVSNESLDSVTIGFRNENICGEGATCRVYRLRLNGLQVAVKRLKREYCGDPVHIAAYRKEYLIGLRLKHDALPVYRDHKETSGEVYIVMDYVDGVLLDDFINTPEGKVYFRSEDNVRRFLRELLNVVVYLHRSGVIHCDLKPANIMLRHSDRGVMLLDLDKSYSDTLDRTSGGTASFSAVTTEGEKPTDQKDFVGISRIIDYLQMSVPGFPKLNTRRFQRECESGSAKEDSLGSLLQPKDNSRLLKEGILVFIIGAGIFAVSKMGEWEINREEPSIEYPLKENLPVESTPVKEGNEKEVHGNILIDRDTKDPIEKIGKGDISAEEGPADNEDSQRMFRMPTEEESREKVSSDLLAMDLDIEMEMADIIEEMKATIATIQDPNMSYQECKKLVASVSKKQLRAFHQAIDKCRDLYPEIDKDDIETELTRRLDYSPVSKIFQEMHKVLREREKSEASDNNVK